MFATSKCLKQISRCKPTSFVLRIERHRACLNCQMLLSPLTSPLATRRIRFHQHCNIITSIVIGVSWIWPLFAAARYSTGSYRSIETHGSSLEEEPTDEFMNDILSSIDNDPRFTKKLCNDYIGKLCRAGNISAAAKLVDFLRDKQTFLGANAYHLLLESAAKENNLSLLSQVFKDFLISAQTISSASYILLAKAYMDIEDSTSLLKFIEDVSDLTLPRSVTAINRIIYAFAECGQISKAQLIFDYMKILQCKPDLVTYNTILGILGRVGRMDEMLSEFASMKKSNVIPDIISYNTLISCLQKLGRFDMCLVIFKEMKDQGLEPDLRTYTALIESFGRSGNVDESLRLFDEMKLRGIRPSIYIYRSLIDNLKKMGRLELAMLMSEEMTTSQANLVGPEDFRKKK